MTLVSHETWENPGSSAGMLEKHDSVDVIHDSVAGHSTVLPVHVTVETTHAPAASHELEKRQ